MKKAVLIIAIILALLIGGVFALFNYGQNYAKQYIEKELENVGFSKHDFDFRLQPKFAEATNIDLKGDKAEIKAELVRAEFNPLKVTSAGIENLYVKNVDAEAGADVALAVMALQDKKGSGEIKIGKLRLEDISVKIKGEKNSFLKLKKAEIVKGADTKFKVQVKNFPAHLLNKYFEEKGLYVEGYFTGTIPMVAGKKGIEIADAQLEAVSGGVIKYNSPALDQQQGNMAMVSTLLKNFTFKEMRVKVDGDSNKDLKVNLEVKGNNPDFYEGRDVELNINFDGNIIPAIKSSIAAFNFDEQTLEKLQK